MTDRLRKFALATALAAFLGGVVGMTTVAGDQPRHACQNCCKKAHPDGGHKFASCYGQCVSGQGTCAGKKPGR